MTEQRAKRILELERVERLNAWDKNNPSPKEITYQQKVALAVKDVKWLNSCIKRALDGGKYGTFDVDLSCVVQKELEPLRKHNEIRSKYKKFLEERDRIELIRLLKGK